MKGLEIQNKIRELVNGQEVVVVRSPDGKFIFSGDLGYQQPSGMLMHYFATFVLMILTALFVYFFQ
jgi:hypothetical protein